MRVSMQFTAFGSTVDEVVNNATSTWKRFGGRGETLPGDTEFTIEEQEPGTSILKATVFVRMKVEN